MNNKNTICLWYNGDALAAATFYANTFPNSEDGSGSIYVGYIFVRTLPSYPQIIGCVHRTVAH